MVSWASLSSALLPGLSPVSGFCGQAEQALELAAFQVARCRAFGCKSKAVAHDDKPPDRVIQLIYSGQKLFAINVRAIGRKHRSGLFKREAGTLPQCN